MAKTPAGRLLAAGSDSGLVAFDAVAGAFAPATPLPPAARAKTQAILALADGSLWLGMGGEGLVGRGPDGRVVRIASPYVLSLLEAENGKIWVGTEGGGLDLVDPRTGEVKHWGYAPAPPAQPPRLPASTITCLARDSAGRTWAGTADAGLFVREPGGARFRPFGKGGRSREGLGSLRVNAALEDSRGRLWVGMGGGGLAAIDPTTEKIVARAASAGLDDETIYGLAEDAQGILWVAGSRGFYAYDPQRGDLFRFGPEDGLAPGGYGAGLVLADAEGQIWLGGEGGLTRFDPARVSRYGLPPDVIIADIETTGGSGAARRSSERDELRLDYGNAGLRFTIAAIDFSSSGRNRYAMMLEGRQSAWSDMDSMNSGYIAPLAPGRYMLRVRAANGNGVWNRYGASLAIVVSPPWWGAWWFRAASAAGLALFVVAGVMAALRSLKKRNELLARFARHIEEAREEERTIAARDVHDEIGQHLMVLNFNAYWLAQHPEAPAGERLPVVAQLQKGILDAMAAVKVVATRLRPVGLDTLDFPDVLKYYVRSFDRMSGIGTSLDIGPGWKDMPADTAKAFFRLLQEMLSNVARHAKAKTAAVRFRREEDAYLLEVRDDGVGINAAQIGARDSFGIIGMREACAARGGSVSFTSPPGGGCAVAARFPAAGSGRPSEEP
jgi:signal transduction histidine kinase/streptogramin lyase